MDSRPAGPAYSAALRCAAVFVPLLFVPASPAAVLGGQTDDFQDGTVAGWSHGNTDNNNHAPRIAMDAGPEGPGDHALRLSSGGGSGVGSMLVMWTRPGRRWK